MKKISLSLMLLILSATSGCGGESPDPPAPAPTPTPAPTPAPTPTPTPTPIGGLDLPRVGWESGPDYYAAFPKAAAAGWTDPGFFPVGAWYMRANQQSDIDTYKSLGFNTTFEIENPASLPLFRSNGIHAIHGHHDSPNVSSETVGWLLPDEADMWGGPGDAAWTGNYPGQGPVCSPENAACGYTIMQTALNNLPAFDGRLMFSNFGKGVMFWQSDAQARRFVDDYTSAFSADIYWYTDNDVCLHAQGPVRIPGTGPISEYTGLPNLTEAECRRASNYGVTMQRMRELDAFNVGRQPIYAFVEIGHPFNGQGRTITPDQMAGAVMSSLINEARGIIYFKHNFGGACVTNDAIIDNCSPATRARLAEINGRIKTLAPVLNTQSYEWQFNAGLDTMLKVHGGAVYVFAMIGPAPAPLTTQPVSFTLPPEIAHYRNVEVMFENRTLTATNGRFDDAFAHEWTYHVYRITP